MTSFNTPLVQKWYVNHLMLITLFNLINNVDVFCKLLVIICILEVYKITYILNLVCQAGLQSLVLSLTYKKVQF